MKISTHQFTLGLIAAAVVSLTACGGGGTAGVGTTPVTTTVMDGLIYNALVCVDSNNDGVCQPTETQGRTDETGKVTLNIPTTEFATAKLIAVVGTDATDMDFPDVKVPTAYTLRTSAGKHSVISPLTDMVQTKMDLDSTKTFEQAENEVKTEQGLDLSVSVTVNFVANRDKDAYKKASDRAREHVLEIQKSKDELSKLHCEHLIEKTVTTTAFARCWPPTRPTPLWIWKTTLKSRWLAAPPATPNATRSRRPRSNRWY